MNIKKSNNVFLAALFLTATLTAPLQVLADTSQSVETSSTNNADTIINDTWGTAPVSFNTADGTLTVSSGTIGISSDPIGAKINKADVKKIIFQSGVKAPENSSFLFSLDTGDGSYNGFKTLTTIDGPLDTSNVKNMSYMFYGSAVTNLDLNSFDTSQVTNMTGMLSFTAATSLDLSGFDTSQVTDMNGMFANSVATSINLSSFKTSNVINMNAMFYRSAVTNLDLSSFDTSQVTAMAGMFNGSKATSIDISSFDTSQVATMATMFYKSPVNTLKLGTKSKFNSTVNLAENTASPYTGKWVRIDPQLPSSIYDSSSDLTTNYDGSNPGTYVRQKTQAKAVTVNYQDADGKKIAEPQTVTGYVGDSYDVSTSDYKKDIPGYTFKEVNGNTTGTLSDQAVTVTYVYTKTQAKAVTVNYQDADGKKIAEPQTVTGYVGDSYDVSTSDYKKDIPGYTYKEVKGNTTGTLSDQAVTVTYVYTKTQAPIPNPNNPESGNTSDLDQNKNKADMDHDKTESDTVRKQSNTKNNDLVVKQLINAVLPDTSAEKVGFSVVFAVIIAAITGGLIFKNRRNKQ